MKRIPIFLCILMITLMTLSDANAAIALYSQQPDLKIEISKTKLRFDASRTDLPMDSNDQNVPEIKATSSFSSLPSTLYIHTDQEIICLFEIQYEVKQFEKYQPSLPVALSSLFLHLFRIIVSPNAP